MNGALLQLGLGIFLSLQSAIIAVSYAHGCMPGTCIAPVGHLLWVHCLSIAPPPVAAVAECPAAVAALNPHTPSQAYIARISSQEVVTLGVQPPLLLSPPSTLKDLQQQHLPLVPLCCPPAGPHATIFSHAQHLQQELQQLLPHSTQMSLQEICSAAGIQAASSMQHPLFQAGMVVAGSYVAAAEAAAGLDLVLVLVPAAGSSSSSSTASQVYLHYNTGLFTAEGATLMAQHLQVIMTA